MTRPSRPWTVTPHDPIEKLDDNLWAVAGQVPGFGFRRRMLIVKLDSGDLLFFHAVPVEESALAEIRAWGRPAHLVIAHDQHGIDADAFKEKLGLTMYGPRASEAKMRVKMKLDATIDALPPDPACSVESVPGAKSGEPVVTVRSGGGARISLAFSDVVQNARPGSIAWPFRLFGFSSQAPKVVPAWRFLFLGDRAQLKKAFERWATIPNLTRIVPCHGEIEARDAAGALRALAASL